MEISVLSKSKSCIKHLLTWIASPLYQRPALAGLPQPNNTAARVVLNLHKRLYCTKGDKLAQLNSRSTKDIGFTYRRRPAFPTSVFSAGTAKKRAENYRNRSGLDADVDKPVKDTESFQITTPDHPLTPSEWAKIKVSLNKPERFEKIMMEKLLSANVEINIAKSFLTYLIQEKGTLSYENLLRYLTLCVKGGHQAETFDTYEIMKTCFKTFDIGASTLFIKAFSQTDRWREAIDMLHGMQKVLLPSPRNYGDAIAGATTHGDTEMGWKLYAELLELGIMPNQETWEILFQSGITQRGHEENLFSILSYMRDNQIYPKPPLIQSIKAWFENLPGQKWKGEYSYVVPSGECRSCKASLESIQLNEEEYAQLKDDVMKKVIEAGDVFNKTNPEELKSFKSFVSQRPPFDIVIDGLNVARTSPFAPHCETLLAVITELKGQAKNILVLGRKHMLRNSRNWNQGIMKNIKQKAHCFFTEDTSEDDPFLLYAALNSGPHCKFLSRDLMRDHKACMPDAATRRLFFKWQRGHQLVIRHYSPGRRVQFENVSSFDTIIQTSGDSWHIPYDETTDARATYEVPQRWLCLKLTNSERMHKMHVSASVENRHIK